MYIKSGNIIVLILKVVISKTKKYIFAGFQVVASSLKSFNNS